MRRGKRKQQKSPILDDDGSDIPQEKEFVGDDEDKFVYGEDVSNPFEASDNSKEPKQAKSIDATGAPENPEAGVPSPPSGVPAR